MREFSTQQEVVTSGQVETRQLQKGVLGLLQEVQILEVEAKRRGLELEDREARNIGDEFMFDLVGSTDAKSLELKAAQLTGYRDTLKKFLMYQGTDAQLERRPAVRERALVHAKEQFASLVDEAWEEFPKAIKVAKLTTRATGDTVPFPLEHWRQKINSDGQLSFEEQRLLRETLFAFRYKWDRLVRDQAATLKVESQETKPSVEVAAQVNKYLTDARWWEAVFDLRLRRLTQDIPSSEIATAAAEAFAPERIPTDQVRRAILQALSSVDGGVKDIRRGFRSGAERLTAERRYDALVWYFIAKRKVLETSMRYTELASQRGTPEAVPRVALEDPRQLQRRVQAIIDLSSEEARAEVAKPFHA